MKIVSGGQTGVDRAALDAAMNLGVETGGWCPEGRLAEDGEISDEYMLQKLPGGDYEARTRKNVVDSDGSAIIYFDYLSGGTEYTVLCCIEEEKPYVLIDGAELFSERATDKIDRFIDQFKIDTLNVAGPRASGDERAYVFTYGVFERYLKRVKRKSNYLLDGVGISDEDEKELCDCLEDTFWEEPEAVDE